MCTQQFLQTRHEKLTCQQKEYETQMQYRQHLQVSQNILLQRAEELSNIVFGLLDVLGKIYFQLFAYSAQIFQGLSIYLICFSVA